MENQNEVVEDLKVEETVEQSQDTQPEKNEEIKIDETTTKTFTQKELDDIIDRRLARLKEAASKEKEAILSEKEQEYQEKLKTIESDRNLLAEDLQSKALELQRVQLGIKKDSYEEALVLRDFKMKKDENLSEEDALKMVLKERPDYRDKITEPIGMEITETPKETPLYSEEMLNMYPYLRKITNQ